MTLSHLKTQIRWAASDSKICRRRLAPLLLALRLMVSLSFRFSWCSSVGGAMVPHPRMIPRFISGQGICVCGQRSCARDHMMFHGAA